MLDDTFKLKFKTMQLMCTDENKNVDLHNHNEFEILLITEGNPDLLIGDNIYHTKKNDIVFVNPLETHSVRSYDKPYKLKCMCFNLSVISDKKINEKLENIRISNYMNSEKYDISYIKSLYIRIFQLYNKPDEWSDSEISANLMMIFIYLFRKEFLCQKEPESKSLEFRSLVLEYIALHYAENITSFDLSKLLSYSQEHFCRKFRSDFGRSFSDYLLMYRVTMSKIFLEEKDITIGQVAYKCGFSSADYFSRSFKKMVGILPSEYRKKVKGR